MRADPESIREALSREIDHLDPKWKQIFQQEILQPYFDRILDRLAQCDAQGYTVYPSKNQIFKAFSLTDWADLKVVILGQDPYHGHQQAMGLSFSVNRGVRVPPSLRRIFKELEDDVDVTVPMHGDLTGWAQQGVLLLNSILTVESGRAGSHRKIGWETFTDNIIKHISDKLDGIIFMLWGEYAKRKAVLIDTDRHHILTSVHPSPLAGKAFLGNRHFSKANELLRLSGRSPIEWQV